MNKLMLLPVLILLLAVAPFDSQSYFSVQKEELLLGEPLEISILVQPEFLSVDGPSGNYRFMGAANSPVIFIPESPGAYTIMARSGNKTQSMNVTVLQERYDFAISQKLSDQKVKIMEGGTVLLNKNRELLDNSVAYSVIKKDHPLVDIEIENNGFRFFAKNVSAQNIPEIKGQSLQAISKQKGMRITDLTIINSSGGEFTKKATGDTLLECVGWPSCDWETIQDIEKGQEYTVQAPVGNVAYAEAGVATINSIKPIYKTGDTAELLVAVLDNEGYLVDAELNVTITEPDGDLTLVQKNSWQSETKGIYRIDFTTSSEGVHDIEVSALGNGVENRMWSNFSVNDSRLFDIIRKTPISIDPWSGPFRTTLQVIPELPNPGLLTITEELPGNYKIFDAGGARVSQGDTIMLSWTVQPGETVTYTANSPLVSPDLYSLRATVDYGSGLQQETFSEFRPWWMAIDPTDTLSPIVSVNTELDGTDLTAGEVSDITTDDASVVTFSKSSVLTADLSSPTNATPIKSVSAFSCTVIYNSEAFSPDATFRVDDSIGGNILGSTTLPPSTGGDNSVTLSNLQNSANFDIADLTSINVFVQNNDGGKPQSMSVDAISCSVTYEELDVIAPTVTINDPADNSYFNRNDLTFNYTPSDNVGLANCSLYVDGTLNVSNTSAVTNNAVNSLTADFGEGTYSYYVSCFDPDGNEGQSATQSVTFDTTAPGAFGLNAPPNDTVSTDLTPTFEWLATTEANFVNYTLLLDDDPAFSSPNYIRETTNTVTNNSYTFTTILSANVGYYWKVIAEDLVGLQTESTQTFIYTTDTIIPGVFDLISPADTTISSDTTPLLDWSDSTETNFANYTIQFDDDPAFGSVNHEYSSITSDYQVLGGEALATDTQFNWRVIAYDEAGQSRISTSTSTYTTDNTGPSVTALSPPDSTTETSTNTVEFNYSTTDTLDIVSQCELLINGTSEQTDTSITEGTTQTFNQFLSNGFYQWQLRCTDPSGNTGLSTLRDLTVSVTVDNTAPNILLNFPEPDGFLNVSTVQFNYTPQDATGILNCSIYLDGSLDQSDFSVEANEPNFFTINPISEAQHSWSVACYDNSTNENFGESATQNFTIDLTNPAAFDLVSPADDTILNDNTPFIDWQSSSDTNFANYTIEIDDNADFSSPEYLFNTFSAGTSELTTETLADDVYSWRVIAYDSAGNSRLSTSTRNFTIDAQAPTYSNAAEGPADPVEYNPSRTYNFSIDVSDIRLDSVVFEHSFNGAFENLTPNVSSSTYSVILSGIDVGTYSYKWYMNDTAGNTNETSPQAYEVIKNVTTTSLFLDSTQANLTINESTIVNITGELNWPIDGVVTIRRNGTALNSSVSPVTRLQNFSTPGYYEILAEYLGSTNYEASSDALFVSVLDDIAPAVTLIEPANASTDVDGIVSYGYQVQDTNAVDSCTLYVDGVANGTANDPAKGTTLFFNRVYETSQSFLWFVGCTDAAGRQANSTEFNLTIEINEFNLNLNPVVCSDADGCTASNLNTSNGVFEGHGALQRNPVRNNFVYANLSSANIPLGAEILNVSALWDKYQDIAEGTFFLSFWNGSAWLQECSQTFTQSSTATTDPLSCTFSDLPSVDEFNNGLNLRADFFYAGNPNGRQFGTDYIELNVTYREDVTDPSVTLEDPVNGFETGAGLQEFNITASDTNLQNCTLYGDFSGTWAPESTITINDNLTSGVISSFNPVDLQVGFFVWNAQCYDIASNFAFANQNFTVNITPPDLSILSQDIVFESGVREGDTTIVNATVFNLGFTTATNFIVEFFRGDPNTGGTQLGSVQLVSSLAYLENITLSESFSAAIGNNDIYVRVDGTAVVTESDETNNLANNILRVNAYHRFYGNTTKNTTLDTPNNSSFKAFVQTADSTGSIFFARGGSSISFADLKPLGKNTGNLNTSNDFSEADTLLNMTGFNDSVNKLWANETDRPVNVSSFLVAGQTVNEVPVVRSDASFNFKTGILWDSSDDLASNTEYDATDAEDLIFVANSENDLQGTFGTQDYEAVVPAKLREYAGGPVEMVEIYVELT